MKIQRREENTGNLERERISEKLQKKEMLEPNLNMCLSRLSKNDRRDSEFIEMFQTFFMKFFYFSCVF